MLKMILRSYARHISTEASISTIIADVRQTNERTMDPKTFDDYIEALKDLYILEDMRAWNPNIRSKTTIRSTPTRHFVDTSIACRALGVMPEDLLNDLESFGLFFEDMAVRDLKVYAGVRGGEVFHYRDKSGLECDAVVHLDNGQWGAIEIKLGGDKLINEGVQHLTEIANSIDTEKMNACCDLLLGKHDFACFAKKHSDAKTTISTISEAFWEQKDNQIVFTISADRFLRNMVRAIVGTLLLVGKNKLSQDDFTAILEQKNRALAGESAPAKGLFLTDIQYPSDIFLPC